MSRKCDCCGKIIPTGSDYISVTFMGVENMEKLFGTSELDFCSFECLVKFWSKQEGKRKLENELPADIVKRLKSVKPLNSEEEGERK